MVSMGDKWGGRGLAMGRQGSKRRVCWSVEKPSIRKMGEGTGGWVSMEERIDGRFSMGK